MPAQINAPQHQARAQELIYTVLYIQYIYIPVGVRRGQRPPSSSRSLLLLLPVRDDDNDDDGNQKSWLRD